MHFCGAFCCTLYSRKVRLHRHGLPRTQRAQLGRRILAESRSALKLGPGSYSLSAALMGPAGVLGKDTARWLGRSKTPFKPSKSERYACPRSHVDQSRLPMFSAALDAKFRSCDVVKLHPVMSPKGHHSSAFHNHPRKDRRTRPVRDYRAGVRSIDLMALRRGRRPDQWSSPRRNPAAGADSG